VEHFAITPDYAIGLHKFRQRLRSTGCLNVEFIKCHITGPFTFAAAIKDESGKALLHDKVFLQAVIKGLLMKALWQIKYLSEFGKRIVVFIDEPYLGCFGSAYTPLNREEVITGLTELTEAIKAEGALTGVHCCGNTDWSIFTDTKTIDIINFDAYSFLDKFVLYAKDIDGFLKRGGVICWGIVPTQELDAKIKPAELLSRLNGGIDALVMKGVGRKLISENLLVSPACGLGTLEPRQAEKILSLLSEVSSALRNS
jgi:methionine synthase II (cobalamin-independent)